MDSPILQIEKKDDLVMVLVNSKKLYQNEAARFREEMVSLLETGCRYVVMDMSSIRVMNSSAIGVVLMTADQVRKRNGKFAVGGLNSLLKELFERMYLNTLFDIVETAEGAEPFIREAIKNPAI
jgi:anti-sigma B factor antagonist